MANLKILIKGDTNDADYVTSVNDIDQETLDSILPVVEAIKNCKANYNWESEHFRSPKLEDLYPQFIESWKEFSDGEKYPVFTDGFEWFRELCPYGEMGIHSIESVTVYHIVKEEKLL